MRSTQTQDEYETTPLERLDRGFESHLGHMRVGKVLATDQYSDHDLLSIYTNIQVSELI